MVNGVSGVHGCHVPKVVPVVGQQEEEIATALHLLTEDLTVGANLTSYEIAMLILLVLLMVNGVNGSHGLLVTNHVAMGRQKEPGNAIVLHLQMEDLPVVANSKRYKIAMSNLVLLLMVNGVNGREPVSKPVAVGRY